MKTIRMFILFAIGMIAFTGTANTTANLEQSQNVVELVKDYNFTINETKVVDVFKCITLSQTVDAIVNGSLNFRQNSKTLTFYSATIDIGWKSSQDTTNYNYKEISKSSLQVAGKKINRKVYLIQKHC